MKQISIASVIEKNKIASENAIVFLLDIKIKDSQSTGFIDTVYITNYQEQVEINGNIYVPLGFSIDFQEEANELQTLTLSVQDQAGVLTPYLRQYKGGVGSTVVASLVSVTPEHAVANIDFSEVFEVTNASVSNYVVNFSLGAENPLTKICPARTQLRDRCSFRYKSEECGYKGLLESCDLTLNGVNGCKAHSNQRRFGGCPSLTIKEV